MGYLYLIRMMGVLLLCIHLIQLLMLVPMLDEDAVKIWVEGRHYTYSTRTMGHTYLSSIKRVTIDVARERWWLCGYLIGRDQGSRGLFWINLNVGALFLVIDSVCDAVAIWRYDDIMFMALVYCVLLVLGSNKFVMERSSDNHITECLSLVHCTMEVITNIN